MVSSLATAISEVGLDAADHTLDCEHYPHLRRLALAHPWASVVGSCLASAAGIRIRGNGRCNYCVASAHVAGGASIKWTSSVKPIAPTRRFCVRKPGVSS
jgi:hypothetical protein